jgi:hypothetical protein
MHTLTHNHTADGTYWPVAGATIPGLAQLVCDADSTPTPNYQRTCPTCDGAYTLPVPTTGTDLTISFLSYKGRVACPTCHAFGAVSCTPTGELLED